MSEPRKVCVTKGDTLVASGGQTEGMIRMNAITNLSDQLCATRMFNVWTAMVLPATDPQ